MLVQKMVVMSDSASYNVPTDSLFFSEENNKNINAKVAKKFLLDISPLVFIANHFFLNYIYYTVFEDCRLWFHRLLTKE